MISNRIDPVPHGGFEVTTQVSRTYVLGFGGGNREGMMAEAKNRLTGQYRGLLPHEFTNISADEKKLLVLFVYARHNLELKAHLKFKYDDYLNESRRAIRQMEAYGFSVGDHVDVDFLNSFYKNNYGYTVDVNAKAVVSGFVENGKKMAIYWRNEKDGRTDTVETQYVKRITSTTFPLSPNAQLFFYPVGYSGEPLQGRLVEQLGHDVVELNLTTASEKAWVALGGMLSPRGTIAVPVYRVFKTKLPSTIR